MKYIKGPFFYNTVKQKNVDNMFTKPITGIKLNTFKRFTEAN